MRGRQLERLMFFGGIWSASEIDQTTRWLRHGGFLPIGGRGLNAPQITAEHAANLLAALCFHDNPGLGPIAVDTLSTLIPTGRDKDFRGNRTFRETLISILDDPNVATAIVEVMLGRTDPPRASIVYNSSNGEIAEVRYHLPEFEFSYSDIPARIDVALSGDFLQRIAAAIARPGKDIEPSEGD